MKKLIVLAAMAVVTHSALAAQGPAEARAMLDKVVAAVKADKSKAPTQFTKGEGGFKDGNLYPFCGGPDGNYSAHPVLMGKNMKDLKTPDGDPVGSKLYAAAKEGAVSEVAYMWPKPGATEPSKKIGLVTKIGDQVCSVGYYQ
jgi:signal transduction histidine kinase